MSAKNLDSKGRYRSETIAYRCSPEERKELDKRWKLMGYLTKYRPEWLGLQSLDLYIPSIQTGIEYQGIQHYFPVSFFGGEEALAQRQELDKIKKQLCVNNGVRLIEWPYSTEPTAENVKLFL